MKLISVIFALAMVAIAQPSVSTGSGFPPGTCSDFPNVGAIYIQSQDANNGPVVTYRCTQTGNSALGSGAFSWQQISHLTGATLPSACSVGSLFFRTGVTAGTNLNLCTSLNTWTAVAGGGGGSGTVTTTGTPASGTVAKFSGLTSITNATAADVVGLFSTCSGVQYLGADGACHSVAGSGTVTVVGAGSLTSTALVTGGGTTTLQTPSATATMDSSGNVSTPGGISSGVGGSTAGFGAWGQGTGPTFGASAGQIPTAGYVGFAAPASGVTTSYVGMLPVAVPAANQLMLFPAPTSGLAQATWVGTGGNVGDVVKVVAKGTLSLGTTLVASGACSSAIDGGTATGVLTTDTILATSNADPVAVTGYTPATTGSLYVWAYPTADHVNVKLCNNTSSSITPGSAVTLNWRVIR